MSLVAIRFPLPTTVASLADSVTTAFHPVETFSRVSIAKLGSLRHGSQSVIAHTAGAASASCVTDLCWGRTVFFEKVDDWIKSDVLRQRQGLRNGAWAGLVKFMALFVFAPLFVSEALFATRVVAIPVPVILTLLLLLFLIYWVRFFVHQTRLGPMPKPMERGSLAKSAGRFVLMSLGLFTIPFLASDFRFGPYVATVFLIGFSLMISLGTLRNAPRWNALAAMPALGISILYLYSLSFEIIRTFSWGMFLLILFAASALPFLYLEARHNRADVHTDDGRKS